MAKKLKGDDPWKDLTPKERKRRAARFSITKDEDMPIVIRTDVEARQETDRALRERR